MLLIQLFMSLRVFKSLSPPHTHTQILFSLLISIGLIHLLPSTMEGGAMTQTPAYYTQFPSEMNHMQNIFSRMANSY